MTTMGTEGQTGKGTSNIQEVIEWEEELLHM